MLPLYSIIIFWGTNINIFVYTHVATFLYAEMVVVLDELDEDEYDEKIWNPYFTRTHLSFYSSIFRML